MPRPYQRLLRLLLAAQIIGFVYLMVMGINSLSCSPNFPTLLAMVDNIAADLYTFVLSTEEILKSSSGYESLIALEAELSYENNTSLIFRLAPLLGLIGLFVLFAVFRRFLRRRQVTKNKTVRLHIFAKTAKLAPHLFQACGTCKVLIKYPVNAPVTRNGVWVIEIALHSSLVHKATSHAIKELALPLIRRETNLFVIGVYRTKAEAAAVIKLLKERYDVRGWMVQGN